MGEDRTALTAKQRLFCLEYLKDLNGTQAAIRAGYSERAAAPQGVRLLRNAKVKEVIEKGMKARAKRVEITADAVLQELGKLAFANMADFIHVQDDGSAYVDLCDLTRDQLAALHEITVDEYTEGRGEDARPVKRVRVKLADKRGSLELLGKHLKLFTDRVEVDDLRNLSDEAIDAKLAEYAAALAKK
jgi:phage terminase small subunit